MGNRYVISAGHPVTADAGRHAMECGGNAYDALLSGWLASCLAEPVLTSPGGGGFAMVAPASRKPRLYDFFTQTPRRANPEGHTYPLEADFGTTRQVFHLGAGSVATPGCVSGILAIHSELGRLPFSECAAPARHLARDGLSLTGHAATLLDVVSNLYLATPESTALFKSRENSTGCLREGEIYHNQDFITFLEMLEAEGERWFYKGDVGRIIGDYCRDNGGHLTRDDFIHYRTQIREPLAIRRNGATVWLNPPPSMGGTLVAIGLLLSNHAPGTVYPFNQASDWVDWIRPLRTMSSMRTPEGIGTMDPDDRRILHEMLLKWPRLEEAAGELFPGAIDHLRTTGTTQISIMDAEGNEVSMTTSNGSGSAIIPAGTGFMLNNMLGEEDLQPAGLHTWKPDQRLSSMMTPAIAHLGDGSRVATGSGGSNRIRSTILQILRHLIDRRSSLKEAVEAPRLHWEGGILHAEEGAMDLLQPLAAHLPWEFVTHPVPNLFFGGAHSVHGSPGGFFHGIGDPRRGGVTVSG
ncbi:MAG: gamma-glutamyltransferase [Opitutales bacterium]